jgi:hypothetical protein
MRERAIRVVKNEAGLEVLEIDGAPFTRLSAGSLALLGRWVTRRRARTRSSLHGDHALRRRRSRQRLQWLDQHGIERVVLYPTLGIIWEST